MCDACYTNEIHRYGTSVGEPLLICKLQLQTPATPHSPANDWPMVECACLGWMRWTVTCFKEFYPFPASVVLGDGTEETGDWRLETSPRTLVIRFLCPRLLACLQLVLLCFAVLYLYILCLYHSFLPVVWLLSTNGKCFVSSLYTSSPIGRHSALSGARSFGTGIPTCIPHLRRLPQSHLNLLNLSRHERTLHDTTSWVSLRPPSHLQ